MPKSPREMPNDFDPKSFHMKRLDLLHALNTMEFKKRHESKEDAKEEAKESHEEEKKLVRMWCLVFRKLFNYLCEHYVLLLMFNFCWFNICPEFAAKYVFSRSTSSQFFW